MKVDEKHFRTIWLEEKDGVEDVVIIDQRPLPHEFVLERLKTVSDVEVAIRDMHVRGAGLIGATAGFGMYVGAKEFKGQSPKEFYQHLENVSDILNATRPTAVNLSYATNRVLKMVSSELEANSSGISAIVEKVKSEALTIADEDAECCKKIGQHGVKLIEDIYKKTQKTVNILTHCNAGWLAFVDFGSATAPIYEAHQRGIPVHVWVDETRPRNQGARLTAWELGKAGIPHTVISDNVGGHLMQIGKVDLAITGADRVTRKGDVCNKIGTYLKALAARDNDVPFFVALPSSTLDLNTLDGKDIPIEVRGEEEVKYMWGKGENGRQKILVTPQKSPAENYAFDVTPNNLVTGLISERGVFEASLDSIEEVYREALN